MPGFRGLFSALGLPVFSRCCVIFSLPLPPPSTTHTFFNVLLISRNGADVHVAHTMSILTRTVSLFSGKGDRLSRPAVFL